MLRWSLGSKVLAKEQSPCVSHSLTARPVHSAEKVLSDNSMSTCQTVEPPPACFASFQDFDFEGTPDNVPYMTSILFGSMPASYCTLACAGLTVCTGFTEFRKPWTSQCGIKSLPADGAAIVSRPGYRAVLKKRCTEVVGCESGRSQSPASR